ncbi:MAG: OadG family protein [Pseudomonadota bacterium]
MGTTPSTALVLTAVGMVIVFAVLGAIAGFITLVRWLDDRWQVREDRQALARQQAPDAIDLTTQLLVAATVFTVLAGRGRVLRIRRVLPSDSPRSPWGMQGRLMVQGSHAISRTNPRRRS